MSKKKLSQILKDLMESNGTLTIEHIEMALKLEKFIEDELYPDPSKCQHRWVESSGMTFWCGQCGIDL